jgi:hypothetical protein
MDRGECIYNMNIFKYMIIKLIYIEKYKNYIYFEIKKEEINEYMYFN